MRLGCHVDQLFRVPSLNGQGKWPSALFKSNNPTKSNLPFQILLTNVLMEDRIPVLPQIFGALDQESSGGIFTSQKPNIDLTYNLIVDI